MARIPHFRHTLSDWFFCLACKELEYAPREPTCFKCGNFLIPLEEKIDRDTARIRERIAQHGIGQKETPAEGHTQQASVRENMSLFLTDFRAD